jgi:hypothetical protein
VDEMRLSLELSYPIEHTQRIQQVDKWVEVKMLVGRITAAMVGRHKQRSRRPEEEEVGRKEGRKERRIALLVVHRAGGKKENEESGLESARLGRPERKSSRRYR